MNIIDNIDKWYDKSVSLCFTIQHSGEIKSYIISHERVSFDIPIDFDGLFIVRCIHIIKQQYLDDYIVSVDKTPSRLFCIDENNIVYLNDNPIGDINALAIENLEDTNINYTESKHVSVNKMKECYINLCKKIFDTTAFSECDTKRKVDSELIFKRDFVWSAINIIQYLTENNMLEEANRIVSVINGCNGLCNSINNSINHGGCGCSQK